MLKAAVRRRNDAPILPGHRGNSMRNAVALVASLGLGGVAIPAQATITVLNQWHLGEADAGASASGAGAATTVDSVGGFNLNKVGTPAYAADVPANIGSNLSMAFNGMTDEYVASGVASALTDNFGIEAWVKSDGTTAGNGGIFYNGNTSTSGWGLYRLGASYGMLYGGNIAANVAPISTTWTELALVRNNGTTTVYVNGVGSYTTTIGPNPPVGGVAIGGNPLGSLSPPVAPPEFFGGKIDEVRIFSFAPGQFSANDLNLPPPLPTPMLSPRSLGLLALGLFGLAWLGLRRRISG
jgi:hypothetical protein